MRTHSVLHVRPRLQPAGKTPQYWHVGISYINVSGTFYYLTTILDGFRRFVVHFDLRESTTEVDVEIACQAAVEKHSGVKPRIISDIGPWLITKDFKAFVRFSGMTHVTTSPYSPQSNGKLERYHGTIKKECSRPKSPRDRDEAVKQIRKFDLPLNQDTTNGTAPRWCRINDNSGTTIDRIRGQAFRRNRGAGD